MTDYTELKRAAEAAAQGHWNQDGFEVQNDDIEDYRVARCNRLTDAKFIAAASPAAVLALIAENEQLSAQVRLAGVSAEMTVYQAVGRAATDTLLIMHERDQLKAENEALRKDADRFRRMRAMTLAQIEDTQDEFDAEFDRQLDAAIGNGEQS